MARSKSKERKLKLVTAAKRNRRIPLFVAATTKRKVTFNRFKRNWRTNKMKVKKETKYN